MARAGRRWGHDPRRGGTRQLGRARPGRDAAPHKGAVVGPAHKERTRIMPNLTAATLSVDQEKAVAALRSLRLVEHEQGWPEGTLRLAAQTFDWRVPEEGFLLPWYTQAHREAWGLSLDLTRKANFAFSCHPDWLIAKTDRALAACLGEQAEKLNWVWWATQPKGYLLPSIRSFSGLSPKTIKLILQALST